jgi:hypothetical protein
MVVMVDIPSGGHVISQCHSGPTHDEYYAAAEKVRVFHHESHKDNYFTTVKHFDI